MISSHRLLAGGAVLAGTLVAACASGAPTPDGTAAARPVIAAPDSALRARLQVSLDSFRVAAGFPGATLGVALRDGRTLALATDGGDQSGCGE